jgi:hypothetical protein
MSHFAVFEEPEGTYEVIERQEGSVEKEYINGSSYLGLPYYDALYKTYVIASTIRADTFYANTHNNLIFYLYHNSIAQIKRPRIEIMKLHITNQGRTLDNNPFDLSNYDMEIYEVVLKTVWLKIIQRRWKTVYANRMAWCKAHTNASYLHNRSIHGQYETNPFQLKGMLSQMSVNK